MGGKGEREKGIERERERKGFEKLGVDVLGNGREMCGIVPM